MSMDFAKIVAEKELPMSLINTYGCQCSIYFYCDITKRDMVLLCTDLASEFEAEKYTFSPDPVGNGFIKFSNYTDPDYKCMRLHFGGGSADTWPWVPDDVMTEWLEDNTVIIKRNCKSGVKSNRHIMLERNQRPHKTFLKAFNGAASWTRAEHKRFEKVFLKYGIRCSAVQSNFSSTPRGIKSTTAA